MVLNFVHHFGDYPWDKTVATESQRTGRDGIATYGKSV